MYIFHGLKLIYIRVPKTGSSSFFECMCRKHKVKIVRLKPDQPPLSQFPPYTETLGHFGAMTARTLINPKIWNSYEKIGFIRNPFSWVKSFYNQPNTHEMFGEDNRKLFKQFIENLELTPFSWFTDTNGEMLIDTVYRLEDISSVLDKYGCETVHLHKMPISSRRITLEIVKEHEDIIRKKFRREMEYY